MNTLSSLLYYILGRVKEDTINLDTSAASGDDYDLTQALTSLGWLSDVVSSGVLGVKKLLHKVLDKVAYLTRSDFGPIVELTSQTTTDYVFPCDGYLIASCGSSANAKAIARVWGADGTANFNVGGWGVSSYATWGVFVKKGMKMRTVTIENNGRVYFTPLTGGGTA